LSEPVRFGTVQLPPGGKPFVLMAEHQTTGGYPRVLEVVSAGRPLLAQAGPESRLKFVMMDAVGIQQLVAKRRRDLSLTRYAISNLLGPPDFDTFERKWLI
jgi:allophanate hydrolase subunit 2